MHLHPFPEMATRCQSLWNFDRLRDVPLFVFIVLIYTIFFNMHCFIGFGGWHSSYPVHSKEDAWPSLRVAIVGVLQPRTVPQPGPLKLTRSPLWALLQVVLHEVSVVCAAHILPLLNAIVICWKWKAERKRQRGREGEWVREEGINKSLLQQCPARLRPLIKEAWQKRGMKKKLIELLQSAHKEASLPSMPCKNRMEKGDKGSEDED